MNNFQTDDLLDMAKKKNRDDVNSRISLKAGKNSSSDRNRWLAALGIWMVVKGERLQTRYATSLPTNQLELGNSKKAGA